MHQVYRWVSALAVLNAAQAFASSDPFIDVLQPGGAAVGYVFRWEHSTYRGAEGGADQVPLYLYEGEYGYLHATRIGLKFKRDDWRFDAFIRYRFEGYNRDRRPESTVDLPLREPGYDGGVSLRRKTNWGTPYIELLHDVSNGSGGSEARVGYWNEWRHNRLTLKPHVMLAWRDEKLNNFYYGTPGYTAGAGVDAQAALYASYALNERWNLLAAVTATRRSSEIASSPVATGSAQGEAFVGFLYDFSPAEQRWAPASKPLIVKFLYGYSSDCNVAQTVELSCTSTHTVDNTDIAAVHLGRKLIENAGGWPVDLAGFIGLQRHFETSYGNDYWSAMAFFKVYWTRFPWDRYLHTRFGFGSGLSYSEQIGQMESHDQGRRDRGTWKLLNYLDPSFDVRVARDTYVGVGVSHRSGEFGKSELYGNVNGGSNYIYVSIETAF